MVLSKLKSRCAQGCIPFQGFQNRIPCLVFCSFQILTTSLCLCPPSIFKASNGLSSLSHDGIFLILPLLLPSSTFKDPCDYIVPTHIIQDNIFKVISLATLFPSASLIPPCRITVCLKILKIRTWTTLGDHYSPQHRVDLF